VHAGGDDRSPLAGLSGLNLGAAVPTPFTHRGQIWHVMCSSTPNFTIIVS